MSPRYISKDGVWYVAREKVGLVNRSPKAITNPSEEGSDGFDKKVGPGEPFIYEGPDRAALYELFKADNSGSIVTLGIPFHEDVDLQDRIRQRGYKSVAEYAKAFGYSKEKSDKKFDEQIAKVETHTLPKKVEMIEAAQSGGNDTAGDRGLKGNFGERPIIEG